MYSYVNKINIATNPEKNEISISFMQQYPVFADEAPDENGNPRVSAVNNDEVVSNIIVTKEFASKIVELLSQTI